MRFFSFTKDLDPIFTSSFEKEVNVINNEPSWEQLEILQPLKEDSCSVLNSIDHTITCSGYKCLQNELAHYKTEKECIQRHILLKTLLKQPELLKELRSLLHKLKPLEQDVLWCLKDKSASEKDILRIGYFTNSYLQWLNNYPYMLGFLNFFTTLLAPLYGILSPVLIVILPYVYLRLFTRIPVSFSTYYAILKGTGLSFLQMFQSKNRKLDVLKMLSKLCSGIIYFQNVYQNFRMSKRTIYIGSRAQDKIYALQDYYIHIQQFLQSHPQFCELLNDQHYTCNKCIFNLNSNKKSTSVYFKNWAPCLQDFKNYTTIFNKGCYIDLLQSNINAIGFLDMLQSTCALLETKEWCLPRFIPRKKEQFPRILYRNIGHPCLKQPVKNTIYTTPTKKDVLVTGPNAGGKSTLLKTLGINLLLGQTLGCCCASKAHVSYFDHIFTQIQVSDTNGKESLFQAEMNRSYHHIQKIKEAQKKNEFCFTLMDEIFSSTNPEEGAAGAWSICETLSQYKNSMVFVTTHFSDLTLLEKEKHIYFQNWKMPITRKDGKIHYQYISSKGKCSQAIALELLKKKGFSPVILKKALHFLNKKQHYLKETLFKE